MHQTTAYSGNDISSSPIERIFSIDVIRGFAVLGILFISIWEFGGFTNNQKLFYETGPHGGNYKLMNAVSMLFEGKMRALFAMVFGAGIILFLRKTSSGFSSTEYGLTRPDAYIRRNLWLMAFGLFNGFILLWPGDILFHLGVVAILIYPFHRMSPRGLLIAAMVCTLIYCGKQYWNFADDRKDLRKYKAVKLIDDKFKADSTSRAKQDSLDKTKDSVAFLAKLPERKLRDSLVKKKDTLTKKQAEEKGKWEGTIKSLKYDSTADDRTNKLMWSKKWNKIAYHMMNKTKQRESWWLYQIGVWDIASLMFLGMALLGLGFFTGRYSSTKHILIGLIFISIGLALAWYRIRLNELRIEDYQKFIEKQPLPYNFLFPIERIVQAVGYASLIVGLLRSRLFTWIWKAFSLVGRMALSNYFLQTIVCTFFFYGFGFGYFGRLKQWELYFFVTEMALVQIAFSVLWLRYYQLGPVEWLWRCLVYKKWLPNKKGEI